MKTLLLSITLTLLSFLINSQSILCEGNLGNNILQNGDFGSGIENISEQAEEIVSAYAYISQTPPPSGYYLLTNDTGAWDFLYPSWLAIGDNSDDPDGYFMVVNGDNISSIFYEQVVENLCEHTTYTFSIDIINMLKINASSQVLPNISFLVNDESMMNTGDILQNEQWNRYSFSFTTRRGESKVKISLKNEVMEGTG
ncbi:MAG: hypothetical protein AAFP82_01065, partial [Bacteroidota bacterium]